MTKVGIGKGNYILICDLSEITCIYRKQFHRQISRSCSNGKGRHISNRRDGDGNARSPESR